MISDKKRGKYYTRKWTFRFLVGAMFLMLIGTLANFWHPGAEEAQAETVVGMVIDSEEIHKRNYLLVELENGEEVRVSLSSYKDVRVGADVRLLKTPASPQSGIKWYYNFLHYID